VGKESEPLRAHRPRNKAVLVSGRRHSWTEREGKTNTKEKRDDRQSKFLDKPFNNNFSYHWLQEHIKF